jgi:uncharacterized protein (TIGR02145 family)
MQKKLYLLALVVMIALIGLAITDSNAEYVCGDANSDGALNVSDAVFIINHVFVGGDAPDPDCCDFACGSVVTDYDGNFYRTVLIGDQCWMMENLKVTHYRNGDPIPNVTDNGAWDGLSTGAYCNYNNDAGNVAVYGRLYNFYAATDIRDIAPIGWHVPSDAEWKELEIYLGMSQYEADLEGWRGILIGGKLKEAGTAHWNSPNEGATNESGFTALPGGYRWGSGGLFNGMNDQAAFWSSTPNGYIHAWDRGLISIYSEISRYGNVDKNTGASIRCIKDY